MLPILHIMLSRVCALQCLSVNTIRIISVLDSFVFWTKFLERGRGMERLSLYGEVQCIIDNGHMGSSPCGQNDLLTDTTENTTLP